MRVSYHIHRRKRATMLEPFPHPRFSMRMLDAIAMVAGIVGPIMVLPQVYQIYTTHAAQGVSFLSWAAFAILDIPLFFYGYAHRDALIMISYSLFFVFNAAVAIGALLYG